MTVDDVSPEEEAPPPLFLEVVNSRRDSNGLYVIYKSPGSRGWLALESETSWIR